jgi:hypothetical protein
MGERYELQARQAESYPVESVSLDVALNGGHAGFDALGDVPVSLRPAMRGEAEDCFERNMPVKASIVAKDEFVEIGVDMFAAQVMMRA